VRLTKEQLDLYRNHNGKVGFTVEACGDLLDTIDALESEKSLARAQEAEWWVAFQDDPTRSSTNEGKERLTELRAGKEPQ
jgi:hypothetical protein